MPNNSLTRTGTKSVYFVAKNSVICQWNMDKCQEKFKHEKDLLAHYFEYHQTDDPIPIHL